MKRFAYVAPKTIEEAVEVLERYGDRARILAGGTDLLGQIKNRVHALPVEVVVNLKRISGMDQMLAAEEGLRIGALCALRSVAQDSIVNQRYRAVAQAAAQTASPHLRAMGTVGGNLCQGIRCWYYRAPRNYFYCLRKAGASKSSICYAVRGDNRYHSIFGPLKKCFAVHPSDMAPTMVALRAKFVTDKRTLGAEDFFSVKADLTTALERNEILTGIQLPALESDTISFFSKFAFRKTIDFPVVNCAAAVQFEQGLIKSARICLNGVYNVPYRALEAESYLLGKPLSADSAKEAARRVVSGAKPLSGNGYIVFIARDLATKTLLGCMQRPPEGVQPDAPAMASLT